MRTLPLSRVLVAFIGLAAVALAAVALAAVAGCGDDDPPTKPDGGGTSTSTQLTGIFINGSEGGLLTLTVSTATLAPALHTRSMAYDSVNTLAYLSPDDGSGVVPLSGQYGTQTDSIWLSGGGYNLAGAYDSTGNFDAILGGYTGPNGDGFFGCIVGNTSAVKPFCGTYASSTTAAQGRWNFAIVGGEMAGLAYPSGASPVPLSFGGTVSGTGTTRTLSFTGGDNGILLTGSGDWNTSTNTVTGTWATSGGDTDNGTWSGEICVQGTTGSPAGMVTRGR